MEMLGELGFPGSVMLIKLLFKMFIEQEVRRVDCLKAILNFPVDIAFLSLSFGSAILLAAEARSTVSSAGKTLLAFVVAALILSFLVTVMCKRSDRAFTADRNRASVGWAFLGYFLAFVVLFASIELGSVI
jgi:hypothetical protein